MNYIYKYLLLTCSCILFTTTIHAQKKVIDSLEIVLKNHTEKDTTRVNILNKLAIYSYRNDYSKAIEYLEKSDAITNIIDFKKGKARSLYVRGIAEMIQSNYDNSIKHLEASIKIFNAINLKEEIPFSLIVMGAVYYHQGESEKALASYKKAQQIDETLGIKKNIPTYLLNIGNAYTILGKYKEALVNYENALKIFTEKQNTRAMISCFNSIANIYFQQGNYHVSLNYHNKSLSLAEQMKESISISTSLNNIGLIYKQQENFDKALEFYNRVLVVEAKHKRKKYIVVVKLNIASIYIEQKKYEAAIKILEETLNLSREINAQLQIVSCLDKLGVIHLLLKNDLVSLQYFEETKKISLKNKYQSSLGSSYFGLAKVYLSQKKYNKALNNILKSLEISEKLNILQNQKDAHEVLSKIYKANGQYKKAFESHQQFKKLNDSLFNKENIQKITAIEFEYKYKQELDSAKIKELKLAKTVESTSLDLEKSQRNLLFGIIAFLAIALIMGAIIFFMKLKNVKTQAQNVVIEQKLLRSQMTPHFIFNSLSVLQGMILNKEEKIAVSYLSKFSKLLRTILENSRHKSVSLSDELAAIDSYMALQNLDVNPPFKFTLTVASEIDTTTMKIPPMLIQPFIENAIEHAFPTQKEVKEITIDLTFTNKRLKCTITDNGIGVNMNELRTQKNKKSLATAITSERLKILSKSFKMEGAVTVKNRKILGEQGTLVTLVIPYKIDSLP
ncbi:MAG: tetratricopeptide repeat protein [Kordia sp.]|uniref:tetratricopeptide repeat protein n=1 Tax=Kordia sp. TaxID=1965332 RepID=UPI00385C722C